MKASNIVNGKRVPVTHGELVLIPVDKVTGVDMVKSKKEILAHSETGHHHILECDIEFTVSKAGIADVSKERVLLLESVAKLWHNKTTDIHETRYIAPGAYIVKEKTEYNPFTKVKQRVFD